MCMCVCGGQVHVAEQLHVAKESIVDLCERLDAVNREKAREQQRAAAAEEEAR
jgi:hypothetical protein